jgi:transcriptional regulator with XRE-family HTH domain
MALSELGAALVLAQQEQNLSDREMAATIGVNRSVLLGLTADQSSDAYSVPKLPTLVKIAAFLKLPLWRAVEMCGFASGLGSGEDDLAARLASLVREYPDLRERLEDLAQLPPGQLQQVLLFAGYLREQAQKATTAAPARGQAPVAPKPAVE